jgi:hypothetical protein
MEHWHVSHGHSWSTIKLNYLMCTMCMVSKSWNYRLIKNINIWYYAMWTHMLHTCMTHGILLFVGRPTYVKLNQSKKINYMVVESKLKKSWNMLKISQDLCKLVEMLLRLQVYTNYNHNCKTTKARLWG